MAKNIKPLKDAPDLPEEVTGPIEAEDIIELNDNVDGPIDDKLADLMGQAVESEEEVDTPEPKIEKKSDSEKFINKDIPDEVIDKELEEENILDDAETDKAIDEIVAKESDQLLAAEDKQKEDEEDDKPKKSSKSDKPQSPIAKFLKSLWTDPTKRWWTISVAVVTIIALALIPTSRYFILNTTGVRSKLSVRVIDSGTLQPLKNVTVSAGGADGLTDSDGVAHLEKVKLGRTTLKIEKRAFSNYEKKITVGWGSNPLGDQSVTAVGSQYVFHVKDSFTGQPIAGAEAASGDGNAHADDDGKLVLTLDTAELDDASQISVDISAESYRTETVNITVNNKEAQSVKMIPGKKHVFVSKRSGKYDVYSVDVDGKNEKRLVGGTGYERDNIVLVPHPSQDFVAYVASRENTRNSDGYLLNTLYVINAIDGDIKRVDQSEEIRIVGWHDNRLIYAKIAAGASGTDPKRHRLMSFDNQRDSNKEIASSNYFNDVTLARGRVYFAPSNHFGETTPSVMSAKPDGSDQKVILDKTASSIIRTSFDDLAISSGKGWYSYVLGSPEATTGEEPSDKNSRVYLNNPNNSTSFWIDQRDGKGVLIKLDIKSGKENKLTERGGLRLPAYWLNDNYLIYRISDGRETADYIMNVSGGEPKKITDVTNTTGVNNWNFY